MADEGRKKISRRTLLEATALGGAAMLVGGAAPAPADVSDAPATGAQSMIGVPFEPKKRIRMGIIGLGGRGSGVLHDFLGVEGVDIVALCDVIPDKVTRSQDAVEKAGQKRPDGYSNGDHDFERLCARGDLDLVYIPTPWEWHVPMAICAMEHGITAAVEVPAAITLDDCWKLVDTSERTRKHCIMMENCCYGYTELLMLRAVRAGLLGDLTHAGAAYNHDLRSVLFDAYYEGYWRRPPHTKRNGNFYPTHGLGPVANYLDVNRGDKFDYLVSMSTKEASLTQYRNEICKPGDPRLNEKYICGDLNTSMIKTANGRMIRLEHNVVSPQPYDRINMIAGTKGIFKDYPPVIFVEGQKGGEEFVPIENYKQFEHALWTKTGDLARKMGGHGGMDYIMCFRLIESMKNGEVPDMDVYDAAAWSAPTALSQNSVAKGSSPQKFPDFTRGKWKEARRAL